MPTPAETEDINNVSEYLAANAIARGHLYSPYNDSRLPVMLYMEGKALSWGIQYGAENLQGVANYVYALDGKFSLRAQAIISAGGGGSISPVTPPIGTAPNPIFLKISAITAPFSSSISSATLTDFIGYNVSVSRGSVEQYPINDGGTYYSWNKVTGLFQWFSDLQNDEIIGIIATI